MKRIEVQAFDTILAELRARAYTLMGPTVRDHAIIFDEIQSMRDLPIGWTDVQEGGRYRLQQRGDSALFGFAAGPHSWKRFLFPPETRLWQLRKNRDGFARTESSPPAPRYAFIGVRSCDLHAIEVQDRVFMDRDPPDPIYTERRRSAFVLAVQCGQAGGTCFCVSMGTGPRSESGFDLAVTEILDADAGEHYLIVEEGTERGAEILARVAHREAGQGERAAAHAAVERAEAQMGRVMDTTDIKTLLYSNMEHARWDDVAARCLACGNCTMACPTCFCSNVEDTSDLGGEVAERWRRWDSCFTLSHSYLHGGSVRTSTRARYRQWMTHKLASWHDQFGTSGCVGCGRCITWCPVGIDITEEVAAIRATSEEAS
jgi:sulfhydrogenase subunit beta (sulfur reductase)